MNDVFRWSTAFETGFERVDTQHMALINMINRATPALTDPTESSLDLLEGLLDELIAYACEHFADEERLMADRKLNEVFVATHTQQHRDFAREVTAMRGNASDTKSEAVALLRFLTSWLAFHILGTDQLMAEQLRQVASGISPEDAYRNARGLRDSAAVRPLLEALTSLYEIISLRNNRLTAINQSLEERFAERTAELGRDKEMLANLVKKMEITQSQLLQSEKMASIGQLAAGVAHEINNPVGFVNSNLGTLKTYVEQLLTVVDTYAEFESRLPDDPQIHQRLAAVKKQADLAYLREDVLDLLRESQDGLCRIKHIVADLKDFSHVDEAEWQEADLNLGLESTLNVIWNELKYKTEVVRNFGTLPPVYCLPAQLNQVFMNLLVNAAQAIETHGTITISTHYDADCVVIEIADTGKGIAPDIQQRIFEPFFTTKPVGKGTGLGLSIAWDIIKKHKGEIAVASAPGKGTRFTLRIPVDGAAGQCAHHQ